MPQSLLNFPLSVTDFTQSISTMWSLDSVENFASVHKIWLLHRLLLDFIALNLQKWRTFTISERILFLGRSYKLPYSSFTFELIGFLWGFRENSVYFSRYFAMHKSQQRAKSRISTRNQLFEFLFHLHLDAFVCHKILVFIGLTFNLIASVCSHFTVTHLSVLIKKFQVLLCLWAFLGECLNFSLQMPVYSTWLCVWLGIEFFLSCKKNLTEHQVCTPGVSIH